MKKIILFTAVLVSLNTYAASPVYNSDTNEKFAIKVEFNPCIGKAMSTKSTLQGLDTKSSAMDFAVDFGWTFWTRDSHSLEANIGLGSESVALTANLSNLDYSYSASAAADMDNVPYTRYYRLKGLHQKIKDNRMIVPIYLNYRYRLNDIVSLQALVGFKFGFKTSSKVSECNGNSYSYGVYPQYDDLMIDASYMNMFGETVLDADQALKPDVSGVTTSFMAGIGAEFRVYGPVSVNVNFKYECGFNNRFKSPQSFTGTFDATNAPVTYTVADGQQVKSLSYYLSGSKTSHPTLGISLIYHF